MKKYLVLLLVFVLAIGAVSASSALDDALNELDSLSPLEIEYSTDDTNVTVGNYNFTIPEGYGIIEALSVDVSQSNNSENVKFFTNADHEVIMISITSSDDINDTIHNYMSDEKISYENTTIKGHDGVKWSDESYAFFTYRVDNDIVVLQAPQESYFEGMII